jgi:ketosteroid isomerase-like protein
MKRIAIVIGAAILVFGVAILAQIQTGSVEQELIRLENEWAAAAIGHDAATIDRMVADDFIDTASNGTVTTKAQMLDYIESYKEVIISFVTDEWKVRVYGDAAVVNARNTIKIQFEGKEAAKQERFTDTWIKRDGRWKCVAGHYSTIHQK